MNNIVKIILGLNIVAGGAGLFFANSKSGKVKELAQVVETAKGKMVAAEKGKSAADGDLKTEQGKVATLQGEKANLELSNSKYKKSAGGAQGQIDLANDAAKTAKANLDIEKQISKGLQEQANKVPGLESDLAPYKEIKYKGEILSAADIKDALTRLSGFEGTTIITNLPPPPPPGGEIGTIQSHDPRNDFYMMNAGTSNGIVKGDAFTIFRAGKAIGKIEVSRVHATVSIVVNKKGFPKPPAPFRSGDKVMKIN